VTERKRILPVLRAAEMEGNNKTKDFSFSPSLRAEFVEALFKLIATR
jgi:hypothetical protein